MPVYSNEPLISDTSLLCSTQVPYSVAATPLAPPQLLKPDLLTTNGGQLPQSQLCCPCASHTVNEVRPEPQSHASSARHEFELEPADELSPPEGLIVPVLAP